jgi:hypothetical protein
MVNITILQEGVICVIQDEDRDFVSGFTTLSCNVQNVPYGSVSFKKDGKGKGKLEKTIILTRNPNQTFLDLVKIALS